MGKVSVTTYDPKKVNVIVGGRVITGFASDGVVTLAKSEDSVTPSVGAKGDVTYSENANESGTVSLTLMSTSSSLSYLRDLEAKRRAVNVSITDANDDTAFTMNEDNCRITKMPDVARQKEQATVTVTIVSTTISSSAYASYVNSYNSKPASSAGPTTRATPSNSGRR